MSPFLDTILVRTLAKSEEAEVDGQVTWRLALSSPEATRQMNQQRGT